MAEEAEAVLTKSGANELIAAGSEVIEEAGSSTSPQSMSEEEGVSRSAEVNLVACCFTVIPHALCMPHTCTVNVLYF